MHELANFKFMDIYVWLCLGSIRRLWFGWWLYGSEAATLDTQVGRWTDYMHEHTKCLDYYGRQTITPWDKAEGRRSWGVHSHLPATKKIDITGGYLLLERGHGIKHDSLLVWICETNNVIETLCSVDRLFWTVSCFRMLWNCDQYIFYVFLCCFLCIFCVVLGTVCFVSFSVLFVCICVLNYCHRVATQLNLNIPYHISYHITSYRTIPYHTISYRISASLLSLNPLNTELNPICYLLALLAHHFLHVSRIMFKSLTIRLLMSYVYGAPILDVSRS